MRPGGGDPGRRDRRDRKRRRNPGPGIEPRDRLPPHRRGVRMVGLLRLMLTEEFRVHTSYSGRLAFLAFPIIITGFSLAIAVTSLRLLTYTPFGDAILLLHASVFLYGLILGAFGFLGRQYLERTNGTRNYVVAMPGILPMRLRKTFFGMYVRDAIFYVALLLAPATLGLIVSIPLTHFRIVSIGVLFGTALLSFLRDVSQLLPLYSVPAESDVRPH